MPAYKPSPQRDAYIASNQAIDLEVFDSATFDGYLDNGQLKFLKSGALAMTFVVPPEQAANALPVRFLCTNPLPITISLKVSDAFNAVREEQAERWAS